MSGSHGPLAEAVLANGGVDELADELVTVVQEIFAETPPDFDQNVALYVFELARTLDAKISETGQVPRRWLTATQRNATASSPYREPVAAEPTEVRKLALSEDAEAARRREMDLLNEMARVTVEAGARLRAQRAAKQRAARRAAYARAALAGLACLDVSDELLARRAFEIADRLIDEEERRNEAGS